MEAFNYNKEKLECRSKTFKTLPEYYDDNEDIYVYIYDLIAFILTYIEKNKGKEIDRDIKRIIAYLMSQLDEEDMFMIDKKNLKALIDRIENKRIDSELSNNLMTKYIQNEKLIYLDYKLSTISNPKEIEEIKKEYYKLLNEKKNGIDLRNDTRKLKR